MNTKTELALIPLDPDSLRRLPDCRQGPYSATGTPLTLFSLKPALSKPPSSEQTAYLLQTKHANTQPPLIPDGIYSFIITADPQGLFSLTLGKGPHVLVSERAAGVIAAGDIYFVQGYITKITDQSGSYHLSAADPQRFEKQQRAQKAMQQLGLPMQYFTTFQTIAKQPLLFGFPAAQPTAQKKIQEAAPEILIPKTVPCPV